jgi:hypothetical protein
MNNDLISREALKKAIEQGEGFSWDSHGKDDLCVRKKYIDNAPTVEPTFGVFKSICCEECEKRPHGKWLAVDRLGWGKCSNCGEYCDTDNFCANCGADMREDSEA